jgi:hypothetical protein
MPDPIVSVVDTKNDDGGDSITSINPDFRVCYGNNEDFREMMAEFWPCIHAFMENESNHEHTKQWSRWIAQGLTSGTNLSVVKSIPTTEYNDRPKPTNPTIDPARVYHVRSLSDNDMEFCIFHKRVYTKITAWHNGEQATTDL